MRQAALAIEPRRRPVANERMAVAILHGVAERHGVAVELMLRQWGSDPVIAAKREVACRLEYEMNWTVRMIAAFMACAPNTAHNLLIKGRPVFIGQKMTATAAPTPDLEGEVVALRAQVQRLSGVHLAARIANAYSIRPMCAIVLSILAEAYPRAMHREALIEAYDSACERLDFGQREGVTANLIDSAVVHSRRAFEEAGLPDPVLTLPMHHRRLSDDAGELFRYRFGVPRLASARMMG